MASHKVQAIVRVSVESTPSDLASIQIIDSENDEESLLYCINDAPNKGKGLFATQPIRKGAIILSEQPLFTQLAKRTNSSILGALAKCTREEQCAFFSLANAHKGSESVLPALGIFETNAFPCDDAPAHVRGGSMADTGNSVPKSDNSARYEMQGRRGIFLVGARLNHSCAPNVAWYWDANAQAMVFRSLRRVDPSEELCVRYTDVLRGRDQRLHALRTQFSFECHCAVCDASTGVLEESDRRRQTVRRLYDEITDCIKEPTLGIRKINLALRLLKEEGLVNYETSFYFDAFQLCVLVSDFANAKAWAQKAWNCACITAGPDSAAARACKMYWANPRAHRFTGKLPHATLSGPE